MNMVVLVGRIEKLEKPDTDDKLSCIMLMRVERTFQEPDGTYKCDCFRIKLWRGIAETLADSCKENDLIAVKGRLAETGEDNLGMVCAEKVSILTLAS